MISDDVLLDDLRIAADAVNGNLTMDKYDEVGTYSSATCQERFNTWNDAKTAAGLELSSYQNHIKSENLLADLRRVGEELGKSPTLKEYEAHGKYSSSTVQSRFGKWTRAKKLVGFEPLTNYNIDDDLVIEDIRRVADDLGRAPQLVEYRDHGTYSIMTVKKRFGDTWKGVMDHLGYEYDGSKIDVSADGLIVDIKAVADKLNKTPSMKEYEKHGSHSASTVRSKFGSWNDGMETVGLKPNPHPKQSDAPPSWVLYELYYQRALTIPEVSEMTGHSTAALSKWMDDYDIPRLPRSIRYLDIHGPMSKQEFPWGRTSGILKFKLRASNASNGNWRIGTIYHLPTHDPEEIVRAAVDDFYEDLAKHDHQTLTRMFSRHGSDYKQIFNRIRGNYGL